MNVLILGGDGYLGWPTAMHLSSCGHQVTVVDNYLRRRLALEESVPPLYSVPTLPNRVAIWQAVSGYAIQCHIGDLTDWSFVEKVFRLSQPEAIIHYAEQPSAPYSMLRREAASLTLENNLRTTFNLIQAVRSFQPQAHIIKLGTMGEYGTPNIDIEEGWIHIQHKGREERFLYPRQAGSLYHTTKIMDTDLLWFYVRTWHLRVTDLMQGPVYGILTDENRDEKRLRPFFCYDELFGTVLNRFMVQAVAGYPLTVYGKGGQTRGYLNIRDTLQCVRLALETPAQLGELRILNQFTETFSVNELAQMVAQAGSTLGFQVQIDALENPRIEREEHYYQPVHTALYDLGLKPHLLTQQILVEMLKELAQHRDAIQKEQFFRGVKWA
ncbi:MAG: NAD-dependent epimerase/dehydratase family protein [Magnetococcus sp. DMHC-6]